MLVKKGAIGCLSQNCTLELSGYFGGCHERMGKNILKSQSFGGIQDEHPRDEILGVG